MFFKSLPQQMFFKSPPQMPLALLCVGFILLMADLGGAQQQQQSEAQNPCADAPTSALRKYCEQLHRWDKAARVRKKKFFFEN